MIGQVLMELVGQVVADAGEDILEAGEDAQAEAFGQLDDAEHDRGGAAGLKRPLTSSLPVPSASRLTSSSASARS